MFEKRIATSFTLRPIGPGVSWLWLIGTTKVRLTSPTVGLKPTMPLIAAGQVIEPSVSVPIANALNPAARAAPLPEDEPPAERFRAYGLRVRNCAGITSYRSPLPYSVTTSVQLDSDPFADRPEPRNSQRAAVDKSTDLRVSKIFRFGGKYAATAFWEMFNVFNVDNWLRYQGSLQSSTFGLPLTEGPKRRQQLGFRFDF